LSRLVVVSNRVASPRKRGTGGEGGLAVAIRAALNRSGGIWFGWSGEIAERPAGRPEMLTAGKVQFATIDLTRRDYAEYYHGFANRTLWPLCHYRLDLTELSRRNVTGYQRVNGLFASLLHPLLNDDDLIWVHDYHLIPMAEHLHEHGCDQRMGFFLHIPWPPLQILLALPNHRSIVRALSAYDLVGFQTEIDLRHFQDYVIHEAGGMVDGDAVEVFGRRLRAGAFPIGIDTAGDARQAAKAAAGRQTRRLVESLHGRQLVIGVDRLDYSKGIDRRFEAYERLLETYPENRGRVTLLQIAPPSRTDVPEYAEIRRDLEYRAGHVNGRFAEFDWVPVRYLNKGFGRRVLLGFLRAAQVGLVTPLRDGMNLVAKEFLAAQDPDDPGILVLSRFAGAARELDQALRVNPYDIEEVAEALQRALTMPLAERRRRWRALMDHLEAHDVAAWREGFLAALRRVGAD